MGSLKFPHTSGNSMSIAAPATNPASDLELKLPATIGTAGQVLKNSSTAGTLEFGGGPIFDAYAIIADRKGNTTDGGTFTSGDWRTRDLNVELADPSSIVSISSNQFTLAAGTYLLKWRAPFFRCNDNNTRVYDITNTTTIADGFQANGNTNDGDHTYAFGTARITLSGSTALEIQHRCESTKADNGFGLNARNYSNYSYYTTVEIWREA